MDAMNKDGKNYYLRLPKQFGSVQYARFKLELRYEPAIRAYSYSPDRVCVQLRADKHYISATLDDRVAEEFAQAILMIVQKRREEREAFSGGTNEQTA